MPTESAVRAGRAAVPGARRWLAFGVIGTAQLMVALDLTVMIIALPFAQRAATGGSQTPRRDRRTVSASQQRATDPLLRVEFDRGHDRSTITFHGAVVTETQTTVHGVTSMLYGEAR